MSQIASSSKKRGYYYQDVKNFLITVRQKEFFFSSRRRHTRWTGDWSSDVWLFRSDHQVVRHGPRRRGALQLHEDRCRLGMPDPDRQELVAVDGLEQHDRLFADHVEAHAVDDHFLHEIGRASCREKVEISGVAVALK